MRNLRFSTLAFAAALVASCWGPNSRQHANLGHLSFELPGDWQHTENNHPGTAIEVWTPDGHNEAKQSLFVIRSELAAATVHAGNTTLTNILGEAQGSLGESARIVGSSSVTTTNGFSGVRVDVVYTPPGLKEPYHRAHIVLIDGASLVHVLYTAKRVDPQHDVLNTVLNTIREGEG